MFRLQERISALAHHEAHMPSGREFKFRIGDVDAHLDLVARTWGLEGIDTDAVPLDDGAPDQNIREAAFLSYEGNIGMMAPGSTDRIVETARLPLPPPSTPSASPTSPSASPSAVQTLEHAISISDAETLECAEQDDSVLDCIDSGLGEDFLDCVESEDESVLDCIESEADHSAAAIDAHYAAMAAIRPARKRRRLSTKSSVSPISMRPSRKLHHEAALRGITTMQMKLMLFAGLPLSLLNAMVFLNKTMERPKIPLVCVEMFSGTESIANAFRSQEGAEAVGVYDVKRDSTMENILKPEGMLTMIWRLLQCRQDAAVTWATVCSSWIWVCRDTTMRSLAMPMGNPRVKSVYEGNLMAARVALGLALAICVFLQPLHEAPLSSVIEACDYFAWWKNLLKDLHLTSQRTFLWMGCYGHKTMKPTVMMGTSEWQHRLYLKMDKADRERLHSTEGVRHLPPCPITGKQRISGTTGLKDGQAYPKAFGEAVYAHWRDGPPAPRATLPDAGDDIEDEFADWDLWRTNAAVAGINWDEVAQLTELAEMLGLPTNVPIE